MKLTLAIVTLALLIGLYVLENININMATSLYDRDCISRITNDESDDVFSNAKFLPSLFVGLLSIGPIITVLILTADIKENYTDWGLRSRGTIIDCCALFMCCVFSIYYFVIIALRKYRECTDRYNDAIALVVTPVAVPTGLIFIYLVIKLVVCSYIAYKRNVKETNEALRDTRDELEKTKHKLERMHADAMQFDAVQADMA